MALNNHVTIGISFLFLFILLFLLLSPLSALIPSHIYAYTHQMVGRLPSFGPFALPFRGDTCLLVPIPSGWSCYSPTAGEGTVPLIICPEGTLKVSDNELFFNEAILVDIIDCPSSMSLEDIIEVNLEEIRTRLPNLNIVSKGIVQSVYQFRFITLSISEEESNHQLFLAFGRAGEKVIKIELLSHTDTYKTYYEAFVHVAVTTLPLRIGFYGDLLQVQAGAILTPAEIILKKKLLGEGPYKHWISYRPGTEVRFKQAQKFKDFQLQFEKSFKLISADKEGVAMEYTEKGIQTPGRKASAFPALTSGKLLEFIQLEEMFSSKDLFHSNLGVDLNYFLTHTDSIVVAEGKAKIPVQNELLETEWASINIYDPSNQPRRLKVWFSENVPGRIIRIVQEDSPATDFSQEIQLTSFSVNKRSADEAEALMQIPEGTIEVNAISYLQKRLKLMENRISPLYYMIGMSFLSNALLIYYAEKAGQLEEIQNLLLPMMEEATNIKSEFETFLKTVNDELSPEELKKIDSFTTIYRNYMNSSWRQIALFIELLRTYDPDDKAKLEEFSKAAKEFSITISSIVKTINQIKSELKSLATTKLKVTLKSRKNLKG